IPKEAESFFAGLESKGRQPSTIKRYAYDLEDYFLWARARGTSLRERQWLKYSSREIEEYFKFLEETKHYSRRTLARILTVLKRLYGHFHDIGMIAKNPVETITFTPGEDENLTDNDFISAAEADQLFRSIPSLSGLSENQQASRLFLGDRNLAIVRMFYHYGLTLAELVSLRLKDVHFENNRLHVSSNSSVSRSLQIKPVHMNLIYNYYSHIPKPVRPRRHSADSLFVAFDFQRNTYRWDYSVDAPKRLTEIAVQKMIRQEVRRAGLRPGISTQHLRRTCILRMLQTGDSVDHVQAITGMKSKLSLKKYIRMTENG
ncbi:MAG TPA: site-specific integrase, partial [Bacillales bacterium]|nr:site-specific integrase [Bacillales bacterium]